VDLVRTASGTPPCSFCGSIDSKVSIGFRAIICDRCIDAIGNSLLEIENLRAQAAADYVVAGAECVFCERILTSAQFSLHRWIFGICDTCACGIAGRSISYTGAAGKGFSF
jgi:hypothetical protein